MGLVGGLPVGVNVTANPFDEQTMFDLSKAIENRTGLMGMTKEDF